MNSYYKSLGKVCLTPEGIWNKNKTYERISLVTDEFTGYSYISKQDVPAGIDISNQEYWQRINSSGYKDNNIIILSDTDDDGNLIKYSLSKAITKINNADRRPGLILGFYGANKENSDKNTWYLYQYNSDTLDNWNDTSYWYSIYDNVDKFKGFFVDGHELANAYPSPIVGDFAYVGSNLEEAVMYYCVTDGEWFEGKIPALLFANKYDAIYSRDVEDFEVNIDETCADRALMDGEGNVIHDTYVTKDLLKQAIIEQITKYIWETDLPDGIVKMNNLSESVKEYIGSLGQSTVSVDDEDITLKNGLLKFNEKDYSETTYSGYGRVFLRKNIVDGINILEQNQITKENTRYIIQYFHCLNGNTITIPENCILDFTAGGWFRNGTIECNNTTIITYDSSDLTITINGTYNIVSLKDLNISAIKNLEDRISTLENKILNE